MKTQTKSVTFASEEGVSASYSIRLEEKEYEPETVSPKEAAKVIDEVYKVDPCNPSEEESEEEEEEEEEKTEEEINEEVKNRLVSAFSAIDYNPCKYEEDSNDYEKDIYVYRSHIDIPYNLVLNNGNVGQTKKEDFEIYEAVKVNGTSVQLNTPIIEILYCDTEISSFDGNNLYFPYTLNGYIKIRYKTQHDVVTIKVNGTEEGAQSCKCLAFYQSLVAELTIDPPDEDEDAKDLIGCTITDVEEEDEPEESEDPETCYQRYLYRTKCRCSGDIKNTEDVVKEVSCDKVGSSGTVQGVYNTFQDNVEIDTYTSCPDEEGEWEGADPEFYKETCCKWPPLDRLPLPICQSITRNIVGGHGPPDFDPQPYSNWTVSYVPVAPKDGICGTWTNEWEVNDKDCCDDPSYTPLVYNFEDSAEIMGKSSSALIFWSGGFEGEGTLTIRGTGFWADKNRTQKSKEVSGGSAIVYTDEDACGTGNIEIKDECSSISGGVVVEEGHWELYSEDPHLCSATGGEDYSCGSGSMCRESHFELMKVRRGWTYSCGGACGCGVGYPCSANINFCQSKADERGYDFCGFSDFGIMDCGDAGCTPEDDGVDSLTCWQVNYKEHYEWVC